MKKMFYELVLYSDEAEWNKKEERWEAINDFDGYDDYLTGLGYYDSIDLAKKALINAEKKIIRERSEEASGPIDKSYWKTMDDDKRREFNLIELSRARKRPLYRYSYVLYITEHPIEYNTKLLE